MVQGWGLIKNLHESRSLEKDLNYFAQVLVDSLEILCNIDPMQKWLPLNYSFVRIQNSLTNLVWANKFFTIFVSETRLVRLISIRTKE